LLADHALQFGDPPRRFQRVASRHHSKAHEQAALLALGYPQVEIPAGKERVFFSFLLPR
jgi:hypothetical protein